MQVETFEVSEVTSDGKPECEAEALALIERLNLTGQKKLVLGDDTTATRCPYRKMSAEELFAYETLFTSHVDLAAYEAGPIPLRVLQVAAHAKDMFKKLVVWYPADPLLKDPILIGERGEYSWSPERFLLARWGEALLPLQELVQRAADIKRASWRANLQNALSVLQSDMEVLKTLDARAFVPGNGFQEPSYRPIKA